jgi:hypothetical protein
MIGRAGNAVGQLGFYDLDKRLEAISAKGDALEALNIIVPFESFRAEIERSSGLRPRKGRAMPAASPSTPC